MTHAWRRLLAAVTALASFALAGGLVELALGAARHHPGRLPFAPADPALAAAGILVLLGLGMALHGAGRR